MRSTFYRKNKCIIGLSYLLLTVFQYQWFLVQSSSSLLSLSSSSFPSTTTTETFLPCGSQSNNGFHCDDIVIRSSSSSSELNDYNDDDLYAIMTKIRQHCRRKTSTTKVTSHVGVSLIRIISRGGAGGSIVSSLDSTTNATSSRTTTTSTTTTVVVKKKPKTTFIVVSILLSRILQVVDQHFFLLGLVISFSLAQFFPYAGKDYGTLHPERWIGRYGVPLTFVVSGLSLEVKQLTSAITDSILLNTLIQMGTFLIWPILIGIPLYYYGTIITYDFLPQTIFDGILITSCLPTSVNMCIIVTGSSGGNSAISICNAVFSNIAGIVLTPLLLYILLGTSTILTLPFLDMFLKLSNRVLFPVLIGQFLRILFKPIQSLYTNYYSKLCKRIQEGTLLFILWNAFCNAFTQQQQVLSYRQTLFLVAFMAILHIGALALSFVFYGNKNFCTYDAEDTVAAMFCTSHKTLAFGLPLIQTLFGSSGGSGSGSSSSSSANALVPLYYAPIMCLHPLQLVIGSLLVPKLKQYTKTKNNKQTQAAVKT